MTVEYRETIYGIPHGEPRVAEPGKQDVTFVYPFTPVFIDGLLVESGNSIRAGFPISHRYEREKINEKRFKSSPLASLTDLVLWRRRHYSWRVGS